MNTALNKGLKEGMKKGMKKGIEKGIKKGKKEGLKKGMEKGLKEGIEKGLKEGEHKSKTQMVQNMHKIGCSMDMIMIVTGLSKDEVEVILGGTSRKKLVDETPKI